MYSFFHSLFSDVRGIPRSVYILVVGQFLNRFGAYVYPFLALYLSSLDYSALSVTLVIAAMGAGNILGPIAGGYLADAIGRKRTILVSLYGSALGTLGIFAASEHYIALLVMCFLNGFLVFMYGPAASALLTDLVPSERRLMAYAMIRLALNGGFAAGPAVGGLLYASAPWLVFVGDAVTTLLCAVLTAAYLPHGLRTIEGKVDSLSVFIKSWGVALKDLAGHFLFKQYLFALLFMAFGFCQVFSVLSISATGSGLTVREYGFVMSLNGLLILLVELPVSHWLKRFAPLHVLSAGFALIGLGLMAFAFANTFGGYLGAMTIFTLGEIIALPVGMAYSSDLVPQEYRGRYLGLRGIVWGIAGCLASGGLMIYDQIGANAWIIAGVSSVIAAGVMVLRPQGKVAVPVN
ncbi:MAG: MFS transporter [Opitutales bacterium]